MSVPRVLLADDHALLLGAYAKLLAGDCDIVGEVSDGRALVTEAERLRPDVIVLDIFMPLLNGLEAGRQIRQRLHNVKLVFLTMIGLAVGEAQRLDRRGHRHHGEIGDENERDALRQRAGLIAKHV